jgi:hypothetical protein
MARVSKHLPITKLCVLGSHRDAQLGRRPVDDERPHPGVDSGRRTSLLLHRPGAAGSEFFQGFGNLIDGGSCKIRQAEQGRQLEPASGLGHQLAHTDGIEMQVGQ